MAETSSLERGVMTRILSSLELDDSDRAEITAADSYIDEALDAVDDEEPSLLEWLTKDSELSQAHYAHRTTMYWMIVRDSKKRVPLEKTVKNIGLLNQRLLAAVAWRATMRAREGQASS